MHTCLMFGGVPVRSLDGYLASITTSESTVGTSDCPWMLEALPGQVFNITGYSFDWNGHNDPMADCPLAVAVHEDNKTHSLTTCTANGFRYRHLYTSVGYRIKINVESVLSGQDLLQLYTNYGRFLLKFRGNYYIALYSVGGGGWLQS